MQATIRVLVLCVAALGLSACGGVVSRSASEAQLSIAAKNGPTVMVPKYDVQQVNVTVPQSLRVSEANVFYPIADIVWRGEPMANRHNQVRAIVSEGIGRGVAAMKTGRPVAVDVEVMRFHSLTEKTRYTFGGVHSVKFSLTVRDLATNGVIDGPRTVVADVKGAGGAQAIAEEQMGRTMRVVITEHLAGVIARELSMPLQAPGADPEGAPVSQGNAAPEQIAGLY